MSNTPPPAPPAPTLPAAKASPKATLVDAIQLDLSKPAKSGHRIVVYGTGGIGKSTLAAYLPAPLFLDLENSTRKLAFEVLADGSTRSWRELRGKLATLRKTMHAGVKTIVIDTFTKAEELASEHIIETRKTDKGKRVDSIEGFGWGKGWKFVHEEAIALVADLDAIADSGVNVCVILHDVASPVPNPAGEDYIRWEPFAYAGDKKGNASTRALLKNWADHVVFLGYDVFVEDGKGSGTGTRTAYTRELPTHLAKSRVQSCAIPFTIDDPSAIWRELGIVAKPKK